MDEEVSTVTASETELGPDVKHSELSDESSSQSGYESDEVSNVEMPERWYNDALFSRYWKHYKLAWGWYKYHCHVSNMRARYLMRPSSTPSTSLPQGPPESSVSGSCKNPSGDSRSLVSQTRSSSSRSSSKRYRRRLKRKRLKRRKRALEAAQQRMVESSGATVGDDCEQDGVVMDDDDDFFEMEITPEMMEFFAKSAKHRKDRDADRRKRNGSGSSDYIDIAEVSSYTQRSSTAPPSERPGVRRTEQMKSLYGSGAAMIHGMETAMQLNYDRNCDMKNPKPWPHLPLNIVFHS